MCQTISIQYSPALVMILESWENILPSRTEQGSEPGSKPHVGPRVFNSVIVWCQISRDLVPASRIASGPGL